MDYENEYGVFSDESSHSQGQFRAIAAVSLPVSFYTRLRDRLSHILFRYDIEELHWRDIRRLGKRTDCAKAYSDTLVELATPGTLRADILIWDTQDFRHLISGRDDIGNYERMFFHLHRNVVRRRGTSHGWHIRPDEQVTIDWSTIGECLASNGTWRKGVSHPLFTGEHAALWPAIKTFRCVDSKEEPLAQLADLLAGMASWTWNNQKDIRELLQRDSANFLLFPEGERRRISTRKKTFFRIARYLYDICRRAGIAVRFRSNGRLRTRNPAEPINFWFYESQHALDRAPHKNSH